jgi:hypothetical protein
MTYKQIYAVVRYPKTTKNTYTFNCVLYTKQTSNLSIMEAYYQEQRTRHPNDVVILTTREAAQAIKSQWNTFHTNYGRELTRKHKLKTVRGHQIQEEEEEE